MKTQLYEVLSLFKPHSNDDAEKLNALSIIGLPSCEVPSGEVRVVSWIKPPPCYLKLNADGACKGNPGLSGGGGGLRNCRGKMIFAYSFFFWHGSSFLAELRALLIGLRVCKVMGQAPHIIELDSKVLVDLLLNRAKPPWRALFWWQVY